MHWQQEFKANYSSDSARLLHATPALSISLDYINRKRLAICIGKRKHRHGYWRLYKVRPQVVEVISKSHSGQFLAIWLVIVTANALMLLK